MRKQSSENILSQNASKSAIWKEINGRRDRNVSSISAFNVNNRLTVNKSML